MIAGHFETCRCHGCQPCESCRECADPDTFRAVVSAAHALSDALARYEMLTPGPSWTFAVFDHVDSELAYAEKRIQDARYWFARGLSPDPAKRPTNAELQRMTDDRAREVMTRPAEETRE